MTTTIIRPWHPGEPLPDGMKVLDEPRPVERRIHLTPDDAAALVQTAGDWSAYDGLSPLEQLHADGDR